METLYCLLHCRANKSRYIRRILWLLCCVFFFFKQKTAYEMRISDWSSDVCSSDLSGQAVRGARVAQGIAQDVFASRAGISRSYMGKKIGRASCRERVCQYV